MIGQKVTVMMDRPLGSKHPKHGFIYPLNYGYIPDTVAGDGEEVDAYVIGEFEPLDRFEGYVVAIIHRQDDVEDKLVVCRDRYRYNESHHTQNCDFRRLRVQIDRDAYADALPIDTYRQ